ncbi:MAG: hypothetical protein ABIK09_08500 [Pseudomonadota bacterium]
MRHHDDKRPDERVVDYIYGELGPNEAARFEAEMERDPALAREVRDLQHVVLIATDAAASIPDPPEAAVAEALAAARARCDTARGAEQGFWERIAAWLLTPQLAGALTLVLVISVGVYTLQTGVFDRDAAQGPSVKHEMAPVGPVLEAEETSAAAAPREEAKKEPPREEDAATGDGRDREVDHREQAKEPELEPQPPAPKPEETPTAASAAVEAPDPAGTERSDGEVSSRGYGENAGVAQTKDRISERNLNTLVDLATPRDLSAAPARTAVSDAPAEDRTLVGGEGTALEEVRAEVSGGAGNFAETFVRKPKEKKATKAGVARKAALGKNLKKKGEQAPDTAPRKADDAGDQDRAALLETEAKAPAPTDGGKKSAGEAYKQAEVRSSPKINGSVLDGIVVPPSGPAKRKEEAPVVTSLSLSRDRASTGSAGGDDSGVDVSGGTPYGAEPDYLIRPEAVEAPGIAVEKTERREDAEMMRPAAMPAPVLASVQGKKVADDARTMAEAEDKISLDEERPMEESVAGAATEVSKEEAPAARPSNAAACAALAKAIEEAEADEDWPLAESLTRQMLAQGCVSGSDFDAVEAQEARFRQKAMEADLVQPAEDDAPAAESAPAVKEAVEPTKMK